MILQICLTLLTHENVQQQKFNCQKMQMEKYKRISLGKITIILKFSEIIQMQTLWCFWVFWLVGWLLFVFLLFGKYICVLHLGLIVLS